MFRAEALDIAKGQGFPRVRGDVPVPSNLPVRVAAFSPRARGCSAMRPPRSFACLVFPACAGMFPAFRPVRALVASFPRVRGDVPQEVITAAHAVEFSPRARGCSDCP